MTDVITTFPFDAHLLDVQYNSCPGAPILPLLVVATPEAICDLMSSAVYQRQVLRIDTHVIGLCMSKYDSFAHVYVGWSEDAGPSKLVRLSFTPVESTLTCRSPQYM